MKPEDDTPRESLLRTAWGGGAKDVTQDAAEAAVDALLDDGVLKDLPIVGSFVRGLSAARSVRDLLFLKKLRRFAHESPQVGHDERAAFLERMQTDQKLRDQVGEAVILLLERQDQMGKPRLLALVYAELLRSAISFSEFEVLGRVIDQSLVDDIGELRSVYDHLRAIDHMEAESVERYEKMDQDLLDRLFRAGLLSLDAQPIGFDDRIGIRANRFVTNRTGEQLLRCISAS